MARTFFDLPLATASHPVLGAQLYGSAYGLLLSETIARHPGLSIVLCHDMPMVEQLEREVLFFSHQQPQVLRFPDIETLPYDQFSPHQDIVSERIACLASLPQAGHAVLFLSISTLLQKTPPTDFIRQRSLNLKVGDTLDLEAFRAQLSELGYRHVGQVSEHGEFCARGSLLDLYPMGSPLPFRIDLFDTEIESIRVFDPETQRTTDRVNSIKLFPAQEYPLDENGVQLFRRQFREVFEVDPKRCPVYADVSEGNTSPGIEYYLPLFFDCLQSLFDYLPENTQFLIDSDAREHGEQFLQQVHNRYESRRYDIEWPLLQPSELFLEIDELENNLRRFPITYLQQKSLQTETHSEINCDSDGVPQLLIQGHSEQPEQALRRFIDNPSLKQILFSAESAGRREFLQEILSHYGIRASLVKSWSDFLSYQDQRYCLIDSPLVAGMTLKQQGVAIITENQLFGERASRTTSSPQVS